MAFHADRLSLSHRTGADRRAALFRDSPTDIAERWALGLAWALMPSRIGGLPGIMKLWFDEAVSPDYALPDPERTLEKPPGLAGIVHDLSLPTLLNAYRRGLYPLAHVPPLKWWSPPKRSVLLFDDVHIAKKQRKLMRQGRYTVTFDRDFEQVIAACADRREGRWHLTWITPRIMRVYAEAFDAGHAHSFEVWNRAGELVAGGYGLGVGAAFSSESQFFREPNTSKIGMTVLNWHLAHWGYRFNDGKLMGPLWQTMGFHEMPRRAFLARLEAAADAPGRPGRWQVEADLDTVSRWNPKAGQP